MSLMDLSQNKLNGNITFELGILTRIQALNFPHNYLTKQIPTTFSHLAQVESLDLSFNMLVGKIPPQLSGLTYLKVFSLRLRKIIFHVGYSSHSLVLIRQECYPNPPWSL